MWNELLIATALMLVIEGVYPFINPAGMRRMLLMVVEMDDTTLRIGGLTSMIAGLVILYIVN